MPGTLVDSTSFIYFRDSFENIPIRYDADEIISFEYENRQFRSYMVPFRGGEYQRITELHFEGADYTLLSTEDGKDKIFYLISNSGGITMLVNTYSLPGTANRFSVTYNYEFRSVLELVFSEYPNVLNEIKNLEFRAKELVRLLIIYHQEADLPYTLYTIPNGTDGFVGISGGYAQIKSVNLIDIGEPASSPFMDFRLFGEISSEFKPIFMNVGVSYIKGQIWHDLKETDYNRDTFYDITTAVSMVRLDMRFGLKLFKTGNFSPFLSAGGEYNIYLDYASEGIKEDVFYDDITVVNITLIEDDTKQEAFPGLVMEIGTNYKYNKNSNFRLGLSYHHFFDKTEIMKNGIAFSVSYYHKLF